MGGLKRDCLQPHGQLPASLLLEHHQYVANQTGAKANITSAEMYQTKKMKEDAELRSAGAVLPFLQGRQDLPASSTAAEIGYAI